MTATADTAELGTPTSTRGRSCRPRAASPSSTVFASPTTSTGRAARRSCCSRRGRSSTRATGSCRSRISHATSASITFDPRGNGRSDRPERADQYGPRVTAAHALAVLDATATAECVLVTHCGSAAAALLVAAHHPDRDSRRPLHVARAAADATAPRARVLVRRPPRHRRGLGQGQPPLLGARLPRLRGLLLRPLLPGAAFDEADRGLRRLGARDDAGDVGSDPRCARAAHGGDHRAPRLVAVPARRDPGRRGSPHPP